MIIMIPVRPKPLWTECVEMENNGSLTLVNEINGTYHQFLYETNNEPLPEVAHHFKTY